MSADADSTASDAGVPLPLPDRVASLDVLRGFALLGIFIMNMPGFSHSLFALTAAPATALDAFVILLREALFAGKFNLLFGLVFGIGFATQIRRLEDGEAARAARLGRPADARAPARTYLRRLAFLLVVGLVHAMLLWSGDVLLVYAVLGFALLALRRLGDRPLVAGIALCIVWMALVQAAQPQLLSTATETVALFEFQRFEASNDLAFGQGSFVDAVRETARVFAWNCCSPFGVFSYLSFGAQMATGILAGHVLGRRGWPARALVAPSTLKRIRTVALAIACIGASVSLLGADLDGDGARFAVGLSKTIGRAALAAFYAIVVVELAGREGLRPWLRPLQLAGRMPLTNYLLQTLLGTFVFYGWGLGWWGRVGPLGETLLAIFLFAAVQLPLSALWLRRFELGPVEYLWRRFTYA